MTCVLTYLNVLQICHTNEPILLRPSWHNGVICHYIPQLSSVDNLHTLLRVQVQNFSVSIMLIVIKHLQHNCIISACIIQFLHSRMEALRIMTVPGSLKIAGVVVSVGGTMIISLYKGKILHLWNPILHHHNEVPVDVANHHQLRGTILLTGSSFTLACWYLIQVVACFNSWQSLLSYICSILKWFYLAHNVIFSFFVNHNVFFVLFSYVVAVEGSEGIPVQILVIHDYVLSWRASNCTCWSYI